VVTNLVLNFFPSFSVGHLHVHDISETHAHHCSNNLSADQLSLNDTWTDDRLSDDVTQPPDVADLFPVAKKPFWHKDEHHGPHFKDFHSGQIPEQDLPPPTLAKDVSKIKPNATAKQLLKIL